MINECKSNRTRQVQFRMDPDKVNVCLQPLPMHSMADLFNNAADEYLEEHKENGEKNNG